jgi:hypothetical protein
MKVNFYNNKREIIMVLYDFSFENKQEPVVRFAADISYAFYKASRNIEDYTVYFNKFLEELKNLYAGNNTSAQFVPIERELEIYFKQMEYGHIFATIKLNHFNMYYTVLQSTLLLQYEIDQSFLPELIEEIDTVLNFG